MLCDCYAIAVTSLTAGRSVTSSFVRPVTAMTGVPRHRPPHPDPWTPNVLNVMVPPRSPRKELATEEEKFLEEYIETVEPLKLAVKLPGVKLLDFQTRPDQDRSDLTRPDQTRPGQVRTGQTRPGQARPGQARSGQTRSGQVRPCQARPDQTRLDLTRSDQTSPD